MGPDFKPANGKTYADVTAAVKRAYRDKYSEGRARLRGRSMHVVYI